MAKPDFEKESLILSCEFPVLVFIFSSFSSYRMQKYIVEYAIKDNRRCALLYTGGNDQFFNVVNADAQRWGACAYAIEDEIRKIVQPESWLDIVSESFSKFKFLNLLFTENRQTIKEYCKIFTKKIIFINNYILKNNIDAVICSEDGVSSELTILTAFKKNGIKIFNLPYGNGTAKEIEFDLLQKEKEGRLIIPHGRNQKVLNKIAPQWYKKGNFAGALIFPVEYILAMEFMGITLHNPWVIHGGISTYLCAENEIGHRQYVNEGIGEEKITHLGSPYCDVMFESIRRNGIDLNGNIPSNGKKLNILISWPPSYHGTYPGKNEFETYEEMTQEIVSFLTQLPNVEILVSLHPAAEQSISNLFESCGATITDDYIIELIPSCDIFLTYFSSTIRWALAANKIVVNYDAYKIGLQLYNNVPGYNNFTSFRNLQNFFLSWNLYETLNEQKKDLAKKRHEWGVIDGQATNRLFKKIDPLRRVCHNNASQKQP